MWPRIGRGRLAWPHKAHIGRGREGQTSVATHWEGQASVAAHWEGQGGAG